MPCPDNCNNQGECVYYDKRAYNATALSFTFEEVGYCKCATSFYGRACAESLKGCTATRKGVCNGADAGRCSPFTGECTCARAFEGAACDISVDDKPCPKVANGEACSGHGTCDGMRGVCRCARPKAQAQPALGGPGLESDAT